MLSVASLPWAMSLFLLRRDYLEDVSGDNRHQRRGSRFNGGAKGIAAHRQ